MNKLFDLERGNVVMNPTTLWIPEFRTLWDRDKSKSKERATREISYIVFMYAFQSPYQAYDEREREVKILKDYFSDIEGWEPDAHVKAAIKKYQELQDSAVLRLFNSTKLALEAINIHFKKVYNKVVDSEENDIDIDATIDKLVKNAKELGNLVQSLDKLEKQVQAEQTERRGRGDKELGLFEI